MHPVPVLYWRITIAIKMAFCCLLSWWPPGQYGSDTCPVALSSDIYAALNILCLVMHMALHPSICMAIGMASKCVHLFAAATLFVYIIIAN
jgi:hypothetical protein